MKTYCTIFMLLWVSCALLAQESNRQADRPGRYTKYLTANQVDIWKIQVDNNTVLVVHVTSDEFDPVVELVDREDKVLLEVDDEGSESRFSIRLSSGGEYRIRVHAFRYQGGGNYRMDIVRFTTNPLEIAREVTGRFGRDGRAHYYFTTSRGHALVPDARGSNNTWEIYDPHGRVLQEWNGTVLVEENGEHFFSLHGRAGATYSLILREASFHEAKFDQELTGNLGTREMHVWNIEAQAEQFRLLELQKRGVLLSKLIYAPLEPKAGQVLDEKNGPELRHFPVSSKGDYLRFATLFGRTGRYQLYLLAPAPTPYTLRIFDPSQEIAVNTQSTGRIPVGGCAFYKFSALAGQRFQLDVTTEQFDPYLRMYQKNGELVGENDDGGVGLASRLAILFKESGCYRVQISSVGNGGGGTYNFSLEEKIIPELKMGETRENVMGSGTEDYWAFTAKKDAIVLVSVRSREIDPRVKLYSPSGILLGSDDNGGVDRDSLLPVKLPEDGRYTVVVQSGQGEGRYKLRLIDGE